MKILKIYDGDYPWDVREEKILRTLRERKHEVVLIARNRQNRARREQLPECEIWRLPHCGSLEPAAGLPVFANPLWIANVLRAVQRLRPDRILVRDLPLAPLGLWAGRLAACPVIVDMAEPYPEGLRANWRFGKLGGIDHVIRHPALADAVERYVVRQGPRTLVVSPEAGRRLERIGLGRGRWTLVGNTPELSRLAEAARRKVPLPAPLRGRTVLVFTGMLLGDRGLEVALHALHALRVQQKEDIGLLVIGDGRERARFEEEARRLGLLQRHAFFLGYRPHVELLALAAQCQIGLLPVRACTQMHTTLMNKLFDYMALGLPVVATDVRSMRRVLRETRAGLLARDGDALDFARQIERLIDDPRAARAMGDRGRAAVHSTYHWALDAERLIEAVEHPGAPAGAP
jgi:glycosyltransferase involved in cell wall biosynthesis